MPPLAAHWPFWTLQSNSQARHWAEIQATPPRAKVVLGDANMMRLFRRYILGGKSDKTEGTLLAFLIAVAMASFVVWKVSEGIDMSSVVGMVSAFLVTTVAALTGATVAGHLKPHAPPQEPWQGAQDGFPGDDTLPGQDGASDSALRGRE